jgi:hypothetical protein
MYLKIKNDTALAITLKSIYKRELSKQHCFVDWQHNFLPDYEVVAKKNTTALFFAYPVLWKYTNKPDPVVWNEYTKKPGYYYPNLDTEKGRRMRLFLIKAMGNPMSRLKLYGIMGLPFPPHPDCCDKPQTFSNKNGVFVHIEGGYRPIVEDELKGQYDEITEDEYFEQMDEPSTYELNEKGAELWLSDTLDAGWLLEDLFTAQERKELESVL